MAQMTTSPYINFQGKAREAMEFYRQIFGGTLDLLAFNDNGAPRPAEAGERIMHAHLAAEGITILATDGMDGYPPTVGDNFAIAIMGSDRQKLTAAFEQLSEGGVVKQSLKDESWGDTFGWLADKYGINWMVDISKEDA